jgi:hypothetical protein
MNLTAEQPHKILGLWVTVIIEGIMIIALAAYNIYEVRRTSELVQTKIEGLSDFSARQGEKLDRMLTAFELYLDAKLSTDEATGSNKGADQRVDKAIEFLKSFNKPEQHSGEGEGAISSNEDRTSNEIQ